MFHCRERSLELLRDYWSTHRNPVLIFPAEGRDHIDLSKATEPMSKSSVQDAFRAALKQSGINKRASVHTLRHYAESRTMPSKIAATASSCKPR
jgi:site-specific recombinase XerD